MTKTEKEVLSIVKEPIEALNYRVYDVMYLKEGSENFLRVFIKKMDDSRVDLNDCEKVSVTIDPILDEKDPIQDSYNLEVSSCGLEPHLREPEHFKEAVGRKIYIKVFKAIESSKEFEGILKSFDNNTVEVENTSIDMANIASAKILYNWEELKNE